jgi:hypothetical protein
MLLHSRGCLLVPGSKDSLQYFVRPLTPRKLFPQSFIHIPPQLRLRTQATLACASGLRIVGVNSPGLVHRRSDKQRQ